MSNNQVSVADDYRYKHFTTSLLFRDLRFRKKAAAPGDPFPEFELVTTDGSKLANENVFLDKPVIFIFGSMTCPMTASAAPSVQKLYDKFSDRVEFIMLYVREAHPGEYFAQSETIEEKLDYARALKVFMTLSGRLQPTISTGTCTGHWTQSQTLRSWPIKTEP